MMRSAEENKKLCDDCTLCCEHIALEIDTPESYDDYEDIYWYVLHKGVSVFIDHDGSWNLEVAARCEALDPKGLCRIHKKRPKICKDYDQEDCVKYGEDDPHTHRFDNAEQFLEYLKKRKPNFWRKMK